MGVVLVRCPQTDQWVETGLRLTEPEFQLVRLQRNLLRRCPACDGAHLWDKAAARWAARP